MEAGVVRVSSYRKLSFFVCSSYVVRGGGLFAFMKLLIFNPKERVCALCATERVYAPLGFTGRHSPSPPVPRCET